ncbi:hypothetical protein CFOL_v3_03909, partial [Cephalotus follicularis]
SLAYLTVPYLYNAYAIHLVGQFMAAPQSTQYATILHILRYIKGTLFYGLHFSLESSLDFHAINDADWVGDLADHHSTTVHCFFPDASLICWRSKKQKMVTRSSIEAEYRALTDTTSELIWLR